MYILSREVASAHPRSCGADEFWLWLASWAVGSSQLVRGGQSDDIPDVDSGGLIPARAGRTHREHPDRIHRTAHPRSCGADIWSLRRLVEEEKREMALSQLVTSSRGSSPLVRGGRRGSMGMPCGTGLIPARAGRTSDTAGRTRQQRDRLGQMGAHPRSCGADVTSRWLRVLGGGSSPLVRGGRRGRLRPIRGWRLIPARAGRTSLSTPSTKGTEAHPRSCGADGSLRHRRCGRWGSLVHHP